MHKQNDVKSRLEDQIGTRRERAKHTELLLAGELGRSTNPDLPTVGSAYRGSVYLSTLNVHGANVSVTECGQGGVRLSPKSMFLGVSFLEFCWGRM